MILWNDRKLASQLATGEVTEKEKAKYLIAMNVVLTLLLAYPLADSSDLKKTAYHVSTFLNIFFLVVGFIIAFKANTDNQDFSARTFCLGLPIAIKLISAYFGFAIILGVVLTFVSGEDAMNKHFDSYISKYIVPNILLILYMWRLKSDISHIQKIKASRPLN